MKKENEQKEEKKLKAQQMEGQRWRNLKMKEGELSGLKNHVY